jgi:peptide chain release factor 2
MQTPESQVTVSGEDGSLSAIITIEVGGRGASDEEWAHMLLRMYSRWAQRNRMQAVITNPLESEDTQRAGLISLPRLNSLTFEVNGANAYGSLQGEEGKHRAVFIPSSEKMGRQHAVFALVTVDPQIGAEVDLNIRPEDIRCDLVRGETDPAKAIRVTHIPTGVVVQCQGQSLNKNWSRAIAQFRAKLYKREIREKRGRNGEAADTIRSYMLGYRRRIQDHRSNAIIHDVDRVLDGDIADLMVGS